MKVKSAMFEPASKSLEVAGYVESQIRHRSLSPGDKISTKEELRQILGVARATINEGVRILHDRGRVFLRPGPGGGLFVAPADPAVQLGRFLLSVGSEANSVADAIALRDFLETMVLEEAVTHRSNKDISALRQLVADLEHNREDPTLFLRGIWTLHNRIAEITPNLLLRSTYLGLMDYISGRVTEVFRTEGVADETYYEHRISVHAELVNVIEAGDPGLVAAAISRHQPNPSAS